MAPECVRTRESPTWAESARTSSATCSSSRLRWCAGRAVVSPTPIIGAMALGRATNDLEHHFATTTIFHPFDMYKSHKSGQSLGFVRDAPAISFRANKSFWGLAGSAPLRGKACVITVVNPQVSKPRTAEVSLSGASARACNGTVLASTDIHAHNDKENPRVLEPERKPAGIAGSSFAWIFKLASLTRLEIDLV